MAQEMAHEEGQQHPIKLYLVVWGWLFVLSTCSYLVDYFGLEGYLRWSLILLFMIVKAGLIVAIFMHMAWERLALMYAILVPPGAVLLFVAIMVFEADYTHFTRIEFFGTGGASAQAGNFSSSGRAGNRVAIPSAPIMAQTTPVPSAHAPSVPARLALTNENGLIVYSGTVGDVATRMAITDSLKTVFGADKITGDLAVFQHAGQAGWTKDLTAALDNFKTPGAQALFEGNTVSVGGTIPDADRDGIISSVKSVLGPQIAVTTIAGSGATKTATASSTLDSGFSGKNPLGAPHQPALDLPIIYFTSGAGVSSSSKALLRQAAGMMKQLPAGTVVQISGYTDSTGNQTADVKLSQRRANAVREVLVGAGVNPAMLNAKGYGSSQSLASKNVTIDGHGTMEGRRRNERRVEFSVVQQ